MAKLQEFYTIEKSKCPLLPKHGNTKKLSKLEKSRQWLISELISSYNLPVDWLGKRICLYNFDSHQIESSCLGISFLTSRGNEFLICAVAPKGKPQLAEETLRISLMKGTSVGQGIASDGTLKRTVFLRKRFDTHRCEYINDIETYLLKSVPSASFENTSGTKISSDLDKLTPLTDKIENLFFELHSHIRDIDGMHSDEALDELCKLIYVKLYDEEQADSGNQLILNRKKYGMPEEFAADVRALYDEASEYDLRVFRLKIPQYERSRGVFNQKLRLSSPAIYAVLGTIDSYSLLRSKADVKGRAFQRVLTPAIRSGMGQYFTPDPIVRFVVETIKPKMTDLILDPFCGSAHFLSRSLEYVNKNTKSREAKLFHEFAFGKLHGIEKSDRMVRIAMTDMRLHGDGHSNIRNTDALLDFSNYPDLEPDSFDIVLTNPPFGSLLGTESLSQLGKFELASGRKRVPMEILGLERCLQFLRPGGHMVIVLPDSVLCNKGTQYVRDWLRDIAKVRAIVSLPIETFTPFGANIKTSLLYLRKWDRGEIHKQSYATCLLRIDKIGYDATGRRTNESELEDAQTALIRFFDEKGW